MRPRHLTLLVSTWLSSSRLKSEFAGMNTHRSSEPPHPDAAVLNHATQLSWADLTGFRGLPYRKEADAGLCGSKLIIGRPSGRARTTTSDSIAGAVIGGHRFIGCGSLATLCRSVCRSGLLVSVGPLRDAGWPTTGHRGISSPSGHQHSPRAACLEVTKSCFSSRVACWSAVGE